MTFLRRLFLLLSLGTLVVSIVLMLNFTASNPTGRRYSSQIPTENARGRDGGDAERILSLDLGVPHNHTSSSRQCGCNPRYSTRPPRQNCDVCTFTDVSIGNWYVPDFFTDTYIAEAKNYAPNSDVYASNRQQIDAFIAMADYVDRPLWLYVAVDSRVSPELQYLIEETGGSIVFYFTVPGYVDPVDDAAGKGAVGSAAAIGALLMTEALLSKRSRPKTPRGTAEKARDSVDTAEDFVKRSKARVRIQVDVHDK